MIGTVVVVGMLVVVIVLAVQVHRIDRRQTEQGERLTRISGRLDTLSPVRVQAAPRQGRHRPSPAPRSGPPTGEPATAPVVPVRPAPGALVARPADTIEQESRR